MDFLKGYRTYGLVALGALTWVAQALGWMTPQTAQQVWTILGIGAVGTLRAAVK